GGGGRAFFFLARKSRYVALGMGGFPGSKHSCAVGRGRGGDTPPADKTGASKEGANHGPYRRIAGTQGRIRSFTISGRDPSVPNAGAAGRIHVGPQLARARRP